MLSRAGPLLLLFVTLFLSLTNAEKVGLFQRWAPFRSSSDSLAASAESALEEKIYRRAEAHLNSKRQGGEDTSGAPCAPAPAPGSNPSGTAEGETCQVFPSPEDLTGQPAPGANPELKRSLSAWNRLPAALSAVDDDVQHDPIEVHLEARFNGQARQMLSGINQGDIVPTDGGRATFWQRTVGTVDLGRALATQDLCGCTVGVVASPYALIMIHILENRASGQNWWRDPNGGEQQQADVDFARRGGDLLDALLRQMPAPTANPGQAPDAGNSWNGWFPSAQTTINVVAPRWNTEYYGTGWQYAEQNLIQNVMNGGWVYPRQPDLLVRTLAARVSAGGGTQTATWGYRRRYGGRPDQGGDPAHQSDDRDIVVVAPLVGNTGGITARMYFDDSESTEIMRLR